MKIKRKVQFFRTNGVGMGSFAARIGGIVAPYVIELQNYITWLPNTIFGVLSKYRLQKCNQYYYKAYANHILQDLF